MKHAALRGLILGLALSLAILSIRPMFALGAWTAHMIHGTSDDEIYLDVR